MISTGAKLALNATHGSLVFRRRVRILSEHLAAELPASARVLDVGAGDGSIAAAIMQKRPDVVVDGIDVKLSPVTRIPVARYDGVRIPAPDASYDCVMLVDVLHHTLDPAAVLRDAVRVSRGTILIKDHVLVGFAAGATLRFMDWVGNRGHDVALPYNFLSEGRWTRLFSDVGLVVEKSVERLGLYPVPFTWLFDRRLHVIYRLRRSDTQRT